MNILERFCRAVYGPALWLLLLGALLQKGQAQNSVDFQLEADGGYRVKTSLYTARINTSGLLASLQLDSAEFLREPILYGDGDWARLQATNWRVLSKEQPQPDTIVFALAPQASPDDKATFLLTYRATPTALRVTLARQTPGFGSFSFRVGEAVVGAEPLARPGTGYHRLPGRGVLYALPLPGTGRNTVRDLRYYLTNGRALDFYYNLADAPFNRQSNGVMLGNQWGRPLINKTPVEFVFAPVRGAGNVGVGENDIPALRALPRTLRAGTPFQLVAAEPTGMFAEGKTADFRLQFPSRKPLAEPHALRYTVQDFWEKETSNGQATLTPQTTKDGSFPLSFPVAHSGWYRVQVEIRPANRPDALPSQDDSDFGVYHLTPGITSPPVPLTSAALTAVLGLRCHRTSIDLSRNFPSRAQSPVDNPNFDWLRFDKELASLAVNFGTWGLNGFCQLVGRPGWADPPTFENLVQQIVSRHKAQFHTWEIENEPGGTRYTPESYVTLALAPGYRGIKAADPKATVLGPAIVRADLKWFDRFFKAGGGKYLDAVSTHTYIGHNRSWEEHGNAAHLRGLREMMQAYGIGNKEIWQTEQGFTFDNHADMPKLQAAYLVRMFALAASVGIPAEHCYYFYTEAHGYTPWYLFEYNAPNRAGIAARILGEMTVHKHFDREIAMGKFAHAIAYTDEKRDSIVVWTDDFTANARIKIADANARVFDIMGNPVTVSPVQNGVVTLPLSGYPLYVQVAHGTTFQAVDKFPAGKNVALASEGGTASAASSFPKYGPDGLNDGTWNYDDGQSEQRIWAAKDSGLPQTVQVLFDRPRTINTAVAVVPSSNNALSGVANGLLQVQINGQWKTMREWKNNFLEWVLYARFAPVTATGVRLVIQDVTNGMWRLDKTKYTDMLPRVYELEAYSPP